MVSMNTDTGVDVGTDTGSDENADAEADVGTDKGAGEEGNVEEVEESGNLTHSSLRISLWCSPLRTLSLVDRNSLLDPTIQFVK